MSLYVGLFRGDQEVAGWVLGSYSDFAYFRGILAGHFDTNSLPLLLGSSDCDEVFPPERLPLLRRELETVADAFRGRPAIKPVNAFEHGEELWSQASCLLDCFHNVDGENLVQALIELCDRGTSQGLELAYQ